MSRALLARAPLCDEADIVAGMLNKAGAGLVSYLLDGIAPGFSGESLLAATLLQGNGAYALSNMLLLEWNADPAGLLFAYPAEEHAVHPAMEAFASSKKINAVRPMLDQAISGGLHINTLWASEDLPERLRSDASILLLKRAEDMARRCGRNRLSLFCRESEKEHLRFCSGQGFSVEKTFPRSLTFAGGTEGGVLLCKTLIF